MKSFAFRLYLFMHDYFKFRKKYSGKLELLPCLHDRYDSGGNVHSEYFWVDLYVAQKIYNASPMCHADVGSRVDGFVAHIASFRKIEVFDVRDIECKIPNVTFTQRNLICKESCHDNHCDSLSCLHALEHFGLGRYGDQLDPDGYITGFKNMSAMLQKGGLFYLAVPIGEERIEFNGQHVFSPFTILKFASSNSLEVIEFASVSDGAGVSLHSLTTESFAYFANLRYKLGIFTFKKTV